MEPQTISGRNGRWKRTGKFLIAAWAFLLCVQTGYFTSVYMGLPSAFPQSELVLVYSGNEDRTEFFREWTGPRPQFLFSGEDYTLLKLQKERATGQPFVLENRARTTDQNARFCAPIIEKTGAKRVVLALPWYHLPRALFLTRLYLRGTGITVTPYATMPLPAAWWRSPLFYLELAKFWGSLGRIGLSWFGFEKPIFHVDSKG